MKVGVVVFPGSNCDRDCGRAVKDVLGAQVEYLWHKDHDLKGVDALMVPGGFSYGDYLRAGAIARYSPIMKEVVDAANKGLPVLGICNGFQILTEAGLLPGALVRNQSLKFICKTVGIKVEQSKTAFTNAMTSDSTLQIPIAHMEGNYTVDPDVLKSMQDQDQIVFRYTDNPNGSVESIAGVCNPKGNVVGLMPHPERVCDERLGGLDGRSFFESLQSWG